MIAEHEHLQQVEYESLETIATGIYNHQYHIGDLNQANDILSQ